MDVSVLLWSLHYAVHGTSYPQTKHLFANNGYQDSETVAFFKVVLLAALCHRFPVLLKWILNRDTVVLTLVTPTHNHEHSHCLWKILYLSPSVPAWVLTYRLIDVHLCIRCVPQCIKVEAKAKACTCVMHWCVFVCVYALTALSDGMKCILHFEEKYNFCDLKLTCK